MKNAAFLVKKSVCISQIKDDLFELWEDVVGKPVGIDIKEKKMTLPDLCPQQSSWVEKKKIRLPHPGIKSENKKTVNESLNSSKIFRRTGIILEYQLTIYLPGSLGHSGRIFRILTINFISFLPGHLHHLEKRKK